jgi:hypothetical protein
MDGLVQVPRKGGGRMWETLSPPVAARVRSPIKDDGTLQFKVAMTWFFVFELRFTDCRFSFERSRHSFTQELKSGTGI